MTSQEPIAKTGALRSLWRLVASKGIGRNVAFAFVQTVVSIVTLFFCYRLLVAKAGVEMVGLWSLTVGVASFARLADISGGSALARFVATAGPQATGETGQAAFIDTVALFTVGFYVACVALAWLPFTLMVQTMVEARHHDKIAMLVPLALASLVLMVAGAVHTSALDGLHRADDRAAIMIVGQLIFLALCFVLVPRQGITGFALAQIGQQAVVLGASRVLLWRRVEGLHLLPLRWSRPALRQTIGYGVRLQLSSIAGLVFDPVTRLIVHHFAGLTVLGLYELAYRVVAQARSLPVSASTPLLPAFAHAHQHDRERAAALMRRANDAITLGSAAMFALACIAAPITSYLFLSKVSPLMCQYVTILAAGFFVNTLGVPIYLYAQAAGLLRWNIASHLVMATLSAVLCSALALAVGPDAAPAGVALALAFGTTVTFFGNVRALSLPLAQTWSLRLVSAAICVFVIGAIAAHYLTGWAQHKLPSYFGQG